MIVLLKFYIILPVKIFKFLLKYIKIRPTDIFFIKKRKLVIGYKLFIEALQLYFCLILQPTWTS